MFDQQEGRKRSNVQNCGREIHGTRCCKDGHNAYARERRTGVVLAQDCGRVLHSSCCCKTGRNIYARGWTARNPGYTTKYSIPTHLRGRYNMTTRDRKDLLVFQDGLCAVCYSEPATDIDHDHKTGEVRGMLCHLCNIGLGAFRDDPDVLKAAWNYLAPPVLTEIAGV